MCVKEILRVFPPEDCHGGGLEKIPWRRDRLPTPEFLGFPCGSAGKESTCSMGDLGLIPGLGRSPGGGHATYSSILAWRIPMDRGAGWATVHGVTKSWTRPRVHVCAWSRTHTHTHTHNNNSNDFTGVPVYLSN